MTILNMPAGIEVRSINFGLQSNTQQHISPLSRTTQTVEYPGARWMCTYTLPTQKREDLAAVQAFLVKLRGGAGRFYGFNPAATEPMGVGTGTPLVRGASQTGTSLITDGWTPNTTGILKAGDYFSVNNELKMITEDINSDGSGIATLVFEPPLRNSPSDNAVITVNTPTCIMRLVDDDQVNWDVDEGGFYSLSFAAIESFF